MSLFLIRNATYIHPIFLGLFLISVTSKHSNQKNTPFQNQFQMCILGSYCCVLLVFNLFMKLFKAGKDISDSGGFLNLVFFFSVSW